MFNEAINIPTDAIPNKLMYKKSVISNKTD